MSEIRVVLADDQQMVRAGFRMVIESQPDLTVVGEAGDGAAAVELLTHTTADVVLMDIRMPGVDGLAATRQILGTAGMPPCQVIVLTTFDVDEHVYEALRAGASGFLLKDVPAAQLVHAIRVVAGGEALLAPSVTRRLIAAFTGTSPPRPVEPVAAPAGMGELTPRELEVLVLLADGLSNAEIAGRLHLGEATVKTHVSRLLAKFDVRDRVGLVITAYEEGVVAPGQQARGRSRGDGGG